MTTTALMYSTLASWWPLLSSPADYAVEAESFLRMLGARQGAERYQVLELGSGGGNLASHLKAQVDLTLCDLSSDMLAVSRRLNPELKHVQGDMRTVDLGRTFDAVLIHDAIMCMQTPAQLKAAFATAARHCRPGGLGIFAPDCTRESYHPDTTHGGEDGDDGRSLRYLSWSFDPDPSDTTFETVYILVRREGESDIQVDVDRHVEGFFHDTEWIEWLAEAGFEATWAMDEWERPVFVGRRVDG